MRSSHIALITLCTFLFSLSINGQNTSMRKDAISARAIIMGYETLDQEDPFALRSYNSGFELGYSRVLTDHLQFHLPVRIANVKYRDSISKIGSVGFDGQLQYHFNDTINSLNPYISAGVGYTLAENRNHISFPLGVGLDVRLSETATIGLKADYRLGLDEGRSSLAFGLGFKKYIGPANKDNKPSVEITPIVDTDGDGIADEFDLCPQVAGLKEFNGCPDTDGDGIPDYQDICPEFPGDKKHGGCPDTDGDGIPDNLDECPQVPGPPENKGCPSNDRDNDGVADNVDRCPDEPGTLENEGCPDTDGDGVIDIDDLCPETPGSKKNYGCPEIEKEERETLNLAMEAVQFETGKADLKSQSFENLDDIAKILKKYPDYFLRIEGHTDNVGDDSKNQVLSERRARSCYEYLASRGISVSRMSYVGIGENKPRDTNNTEYGRTKNRRVEFSLYIPR